MKTVLEVIGGIVVIAGVSAGIYYAFKKRGACSTKEQIKKDDSVEKKDASVIISDTPSRSIEDAIDEMKNEKRNMVSTVQERHEEAAEIMKESLKNILDTELPAETENTAELDKMSDDIDKLLG